MGKEFENHVLNAVDTILGKFSNEMMYKLIKPVINLAKPHLVKMARNEPKELVKCLRTAQIHIDKALKVYDDEN